LLKIYLYGYLNQVQSSRRLEREARRNIELMWLAGKLAPDFKTIADFRRDNGDAIRATCRSFVMLCRRLGLNRRRDSGGGWQPLQGGESRDKKLHARRHPSAGGAGGRQHRAVSGDARHGRSPGGSGLAELRVAG